MILIANSNIAIHRVVKLVAKDRFAPITDINDPIFGVTMKSVVQDTSYARAVTTDIVHYYGGSPGPVYTTSDGTITTAYTGRKLGLILDNGSILLQPSQSASNGTPQYLKSYINSADPITLTAIPNSVTIQVDQIQWVIEDDYTETVVNGLVTQIVPVMPINGVTVIRYLSP